MHDSTIGVTVEEYDDHNTTSDDKYFEEEG